MKKGNLTQSKLIQIRVAPDLKNKIELTAKMQGLTTSTLIKSVMSDYLKREKALNELNLSFSKKEVAESLVNNLTSLKPTQKFTFSQALKLINQDSL